MLRPALFAASLAIAAPVAAAPAEPFLAKAAQGDMAEVEMGKLAQAHGQSAAVKAYGETLVTDHGGHRSKVVALATAKGVDVPDSVSAEQKTAYDHLAGLTGAAFDKAFKQHMVADHQNDIALYRTAAAGKDAEVAALARQTLPVLEKHLTLARQL